MVHGRMANRLVLLKLFRHTTSESHSALLSRLIHSISNQHYPENLSKSFGPRLIIVLKRWRQFGRSPDPTPLNQALVIKPTGLQVNKRNKELEEEERDRRNFLVFLSVTIGLTVFYYQVKQNIFINKKVSKFSALPLKDEIKGGMRSCSSEIESKVIDVIKEMQKSDFVMKKLQIFMSNTFEPLPMSKLGTIYGGALGVPVYFEWTSVDQVDLSKLHQVVDSPLTFIDWTFSVELNEDASAEDIEELKETFILSVEAQRFALLMSGLDLNGQVFTNPDFLSPFLLIAAQAIVPRIIAERMGLFKFGKSFQRYGLHGIFFALNFSIFVLAKHWWIASNTKEKVSYIANNNRNLIEGAKEYYEKLEKRGQLLRRLTKRGCEYFSETGKVKQPWYEFNRPSPKEMKNQLLSAL